MAGGGGVGRRLLGIGQRQWNWPVTMEQPRAVEEIATTPGAGTEEYWFDDDTAQLADGRAIELTV